MNYLNRIFIVTVVLVSLCSCRGCHSKSGSFNSTPKSETTETTGKIIKIIDGDTYDILVADNKTIRIRMAGIDAPEKGQPYYQKAKDFLGELCFNKIIQIKKIDVDRHGRTVAESYLENGTSLSYEMVKNGFAWHFKKYSSDQKLAALEDEAKLNKRGLWADPNPIAPWDIRAHRRSGKKDSEE